MLAVHNHNLIQICNDLIELLRQTLILDWWRAVTAHNSVEDLVTSGGSGQSGDFMNKAMVHITFATGVTFDKCSFRASGGCELQVITSLCLLLAPGCLSAHQIHIAVFVHCS